MSPLHIVRRWPIPPLLLLVMVLWLSPALTRESGGFATLAGLFSDLFCVAWLVPLLLVLPRAMQLVVLLIWALAQLGGFMLLQSMSRLPVWQDLHFLLQGDFLANSLAESASIPLLPALWLGSGVLLSAACVFHLPAPRALDKRQWMALCAVLLVSMGLHRWASLQADDDENLYAQYNPLHWFFAGMVTDWLRGGTESAVGVLTQDVSGQPLLPARGQARNVLVVVMEGIPGLYLQPARNVIVPLQADAPVLMPRLSQWAKRGMVTPDFIVHHHQTIRGLYTLLCSDFDKLSNSTPKAFELQNAKTMADQCLPAQLARNGFSTHFLQGAGLAFMGKDKVMPAVGFQQVHGSEWFTGKPAVKFGWGVDDKTFFEGAVRYVKSLKKDSNKPWMLTLLTVGTHQPYAVPKSYAKRFSDRRDASVAYLDDAVGQFLDTLDKQGVLKDTLVIITSDESHGGDLADWVSSWGTNIVFAPDALPAVQSGQFSLLDTSLSVLDYFHLAPHPYTWGRSLFRTYNTPRQMVSNTAGRLRWLRNGVRHECTSLGECRVCTAKSLIGDAVCQDDAGDPYRSLARQAAWLDQSVTRLATLDTHTLRFAAGERLKIAKAWKNEWMDNLIGAQYLNFPANTSTHVSLRWRAIQAGDAGARLKLVLKESEKDVPDILPEIPALKAGEEAEYSFDFSNAAERRNFSFHLLAEAPMDIELIDFAITTSPGAVAPTGAASPATAP